MAFERAFITLTLAVDLDGVPGNCNKPEDFVTILRQQARGFEHYKPEITVVETTVKDYVWDEEKKEYIQPKLVDDPRKPKVGDKTFELGDGHGVIKTINYGDVVIFSSGCDEYVRLSANELTWVESEQRWEYGDLDRK